MNSLKSLSSINIAEISYSKPVLSNDTIAKLKEFDINISSVSSEAEAKKIIEEKTLDQKNANKSQHTDQRLEKIYNRIRTLATKIDVSVSSSEKIETALNKIQSKIAVLEQNSYNANITVIRSEYDSIKYTYETLTSSKSNLFTGLDILGKTNRAILGIKK